MKKIMIVLGAIASAISLQAATANWAAPYVFASNDASEGDDTLVYSWAIAELASADVSGVSFANGELTGATVATTGDAIEVTGWGQEMNGTMTGTAGTYYALVVWNDNLKQWGVSDAVLAVADSTDATGNTVMDMTFANADDDPWGWGAGTSMVANQSTEVIPEPTSGLLLLVGMAGLALRRRRA